LITKDPSHSIATINNGKQVINGTQEAAAVHQVEIKEETVVKTVEGIEVVANRPTGSMA